MDIRSHEVKETVYTQVPSKYVIVTHKEYSYLIPEECVEDLQITKLAQYSVLTINTTSQDIVLSRFF